MIDILIIGAGVVGANIARECSKYQQNIVVVDKNNDVCEETSKANSGIAHSGYDATPGTLKAKYNVIGNKMLPKLCKDLDVPYVNNGSLIIGFSKEDEILLHELKQQGEKNGVEGLVILPHDEVMSKEPALNPNIYSALYAPTGGIVDPFQLTIASAEVAFQNGVVFKMNTEVSNIEKVESGFIVKTNHEDLHAKIIINASGIYADHINNYVSKHFLEIHPRKGEYCLFDKQVGALVHSTIFQLPSSQGKGVLVTPTAEGNLLVGPSSNLVERKEDKETTVEGIKYILEKASSSVPNIPLQFIITGFAGLRASEVSKDFIIGEAEDVPNFYNAAGIESPGLTAAPGIAVAISELIQSKHHFPLKEKIVTTRKNIVRFEEQSIENKKALIAKDKEYGKIICRCEMVTLSEIKQAIHRSLGATSVDGVKRRTRAGAGRCQGGFCSPRVLEILSQELKKDPTEIAKFSKNSTFLVGLDKEL